MTISLSYPFNPPSCIAFTVIFPEEIYIILLSHSDNDQSLLLKPHLLNFFSLHHSSIELNSTGFNLLITVIL